jgi:hypothetical protein
VAIPAHGTFFTNPNLSFVHSEIEAVLRYVTVEFTPGPGQPVVNFSLLSDGQQSLLYIALVLGKGWLDWLEREGVYFSAPLDLDFAMLEQFPKEYDLKSEDREVKAGAIVTAVLGK